jgi:phage shock protein PspC (stress-responsive transcriptional regulator)
MTDQAIDGTIKPARDSIFGVCAAFASDFGFNPLWLRLAIGAGLMWNMEAALGAYVVLGVIVLISRLASPDARLHSEPVTAPSLVAAPDQDVEAVSLARAA